MDIDQSQTDAPKSPTDTFSEDFGNKSDSFMKWLSSIPGASISRKIQLADLRSQGAGRGVVALQDIEVDEELFTVPRSSIICVDNSDLSQKLPGILEDRDSWSSLILVMIYEFLKGPASIWKPYFDVLPPTFDTLMFWNETELEELQASAVRQKIGREEADETFRDSVIPVVKQHADVFYTAGATPLSDAELMALAHRMGSTIMAYAFDLERDESQLEVDEDGYTIEDEDEALPKGMVPLADMLNADAEFNARLYYGPETLSMKALTEISKGTEVLNDYGHLPRSDLLRRYGYTTERYARFDVAELPRDIVVEAVTKYRNLPAKDLEERVAYLEESDAVEDGYDIPRRSEGTVFSDELLLFVKTLLVAQTEYRSLKRLSRERSNLLWVDAGTVLGHAARLRLGQYSTSVEKDQSLLEDPSVSGRRRMAVEIRLAEKQILLGAQDEAAALITEFQNVMQQDRQERIVEETRQEKRRRLR